VSDSLLEVIDLGETRYVPAYARQCEEQQRILAARESSDPTPGVLILVEHPAVITVSRRPDAKRHILALVAAWLLAHGVTFGGSRYHAPWLPFLIAFAAEYLAAPAAAPRLGVRRRLLWFGIAAACAGLWFLEGAHYL
jgi:hypothetical protein